MARLSNFLRSRNHWRGGASQPVCRPVQRGEIEPALRLLLADANGPASDEAVLDFLNMAVHRRIDVNQTWIATVKGRVVWAFLPVISPGRTMLILTPTHWGSDTPFRAVRQLADELCRHWQGRGVQLAQFLLDPSETAVRESYLACGFERLAELVYMQRLVHDAPQDAPVPAGLELLHYSPGTHRTFAKAIVDSYRDSLDCPALNGRRDIEDVIAGHKATGRFDPLLWHVLLEGGQPIAVLILSPSTQTESLELVYLGLAPQARGRGLGDWSMILALRAVVQQSRRDLVLAVDSLNQPALRLYYRHGLKRIGSRVALLRDLSSGCQRGALVQ